MSIETQEKKELIPRRRTASPGPTEEKKDATKTEDAVKTKRPVKQGRTTRFHGAVMACMWSTLVAAYLSQGVVKSAFKPIYIAVEHSYAAYFLFFLVLLAMAEPSPLVLILAGVVVSCPPHTAWASAMSGLEDYQKVVCMMTSVFVIIYWTNGLFCMALEHLFTKYLDKYRIQAEVKAYSRPPTGKLIRNVLINTCLVPIIALVIGLNVSFVPSDFEIPGPFEMLLSALTSIYFNEIFFFYGHWMFHANKFLYAKVHKVHHEFKAPCALAAVYCHPVELVVADFGPLGVGIVLFNHNLYFAAVFTTFAVLATQTHHCGFRWPWIAEHGAQPDFHDYHHEKFTCNYGNLGFLDAIHGTAAPTRREQVIESKGAHPAKAA